MAQNFENDPDLVSTAAEASEEELLTRRIRRDLVRRGVDAELAEGALGELQALARGADRARYEALLSGAAVAFAAFQDGRDALRENLAHLAELQRLMDGFNGELGKLDEALKILGAYLSRARNASGVAPKRQLH